MVDQKFKTLSNLRVRGSAIIIFSDTKQGFTVPRGKQRCIDNGLSNICKFLYVFNLFVFITNFFLSTGHDFFCSIHFEKLSLRNKLLIRKIFLI